VNDEPQHQGARIVMVRDAHGYTAGWAAACCAWTSGELRDRPSAAMPDLYAHITEETTT
jgi:hypothetical protein